MSRLTLSPDQTEKAFNLLKGGLYAEHQLMWRLFSDDPEAKRDFLYRRENNKGWPLFYLLSRRKPETGLGYIRLETKEYRPKIRANQRFSFVLRANAVKTTKAGDSSKKRRRRDVVEAHIDQIKKDLAPNEKLPSKAQLIYAAGNRWIRHQGEKNGFSVNSLMVENHQLLDMENPKDQSPRHFGSLDFQGTLTVTDPIEFMKPLEAGLGRSRGFGCGLLLIRRLTA